MTSLPDTRAVSPDVGNGLLEARDGHDGAERATRGRESSATPRARGS